MSRTGWLSSSQVTKGCAEFLGSTHLELRRRNQRFPFQSLHRRKTSISSTPILKSHLIVPVSSLSAIFKQRATRHFSSAKDKTHPEILPSYQHPTRGILSHLPRAFVPYAQLMRVEQTGGIYGFYFPYLIGLSYAATITIPIIPPTSLISTAGLCFIWVVFLRGAVCTINDVLDREYDRKVARCRLRPIARGAVTPAQGYIWYATQVVISAGAVAILPHPETCIYHAVPIMCLLSVYPLAKRVTDYPQLVLCVPIAWGILMACSTLGVDPFTAQSTALAAASACLVAADAIWVVMLDYVNACQDTPDDVKVGVRSMAVKYQNTAAFISVFGTAQVTLMLATGYLAEMSSIYYLLACGGNAILLAAMARTVSRARPDICAWWFRRGTLLICGTTVAGFLGEYLVKLQNEEKGAGKGDAERKGH